jgi:hypothetical protein
MSEVRNEDEVMSDYKKYRGTCKEAVDALIESDSSLKAVRGHYFCPLWGTDEPHWWAVNSSGEIIDPTCKQFPSNGHGIYTPFNGMCECAQCGKEFPEDAEYANFHGNYAFCQYLCFGRFVGVA